MIKTRLLENNPLPLVVEPEGSVTDAAQLSTWIQGNRPWLESRLHVHGGVLFRGFPLATAEQFESVARTVEPRLLNYVQGNSPRKKVTEKVYTSTSYPPSENIPMHSEKSYASDWPRKIFFFCKVAPERDGETPIASTRKLYETLDRQILEEFSQKRVTYVQNFYGRLGLGKSWRDAFETEDRAQVEAYCREAGLTFEWRPDDVLRTLQTQEAVIAHPELGTKVWFNQADLWHLSDQPAPVQRLIRKKLTPDGYPHHARFGDGTEIPDAYLAEIKRVFWASASTFPWRQGDVLVLDNVLVAHGRRPFTGPREILVAMA